MQKCQSERLRYSKLRLEQSKYDFWSEVPLDIDIAEPMFPEPVKLDPETYDPPTPAGTPSGEPLPGEPQGSPIEILETSIKEKEKFEYQQSNAYSNFVSANRSFGYNWGSEKGAKFNELGALMSNLDKGVDKEGLSKGADPILRPEEWSGTIDYNQEDISKLEDFVIKQARNGLM